MEETGSEGAEILIGCGMGCIGCPMSNQESLEDGCSVHGMSEKEIKKLVEKLNKIKREVK